MVVKIRDIMVIKDKIKAIADIRDSLSSMEVTDSISRMAAAMVTTKVRIEDRMEEIIVVAADMAVRMAMEDVKLDRIVQLSRGNHRGPRIRG